MSEKKEKKNVTEEKELKVQNTDVNIGKEEENLGVSYEIVIGSSNG